MFGSDWTHQMVPFYSKYLCPGTQGVDAFAQNWRVGNLFCHPPISVVFRVLRVAERAQAFGIMLIPDWKASINSVAVRSYGSRVELVDKFWPEFECPQWWKKKVFSGNFNFKFDFRN